MSPHSPKFQVVKDRLVNRLPWRQVLVPAALILLVSWLVFTPPGLLGKADAVGFAVCHRIDARSFHLGDRQIPVCARCTGQFLGAVLTLGYLFLRHPRRTVAPGWGILGILVALVAAYVIDGLNSYLHLIPNLSRFYLYQPSNPLRLFTGTGLGVGMGVMLFTVFNQTVWKTRDQRPVFNGFLDFGSLLGLAFLLDVLVLSENPLVLYPLALVSAAGVLILLTLVYTLAFVMLFRLENQMAGWIDLFYPLVAGVIIGLTQIGLLDLVRFILTGSWDGFHFG